MPCQWKKLEPNTVQHWPARLEPNDECFYARERMSHGGYGFSETNSLVDNFKMERSLQGEKRWYYRNQAVIIFAHELADLLESGMCIAAIPSSKKPDHPEYTSRYEDLFTELQKLKTVIIETPITILESKQSSRMGGSRDIDEIYKNLVWLGFKKTTNHVILIDDVITTGGHFKACQRLILGRCPEMRIIGAFWAKTIWPD
jgi:hypothetical protein